MKNKAVENPNDQAQISNKTPNPKPKNYNSAKRTLKYFLFGILLEIGIFRQRRIPVCLWHEASGWQNSNNQISEPFWILDLIIMIYLEFVILNL